MEARLRAAGRPAAMEAVGAQRGRRPEASLATAGQPLRPEAGVLEAGLATGGTAGAGLAAAGEGAVRPGLARRLAMALWDATLSAACLCVLYWVHWTAAAACACLAVLLVAMACWRIYLARWLPPLCTEPIPYTCGFAAANGKELFLVATVHISPRAPKDVEAVIGQIRPDIVMIELDEERLDDLREVDTPPDLQPFQAAEEGAEPMYLLAQRALWNAEHGGERICGSIVFDERNAFGLASWGEQARDALVLVRRGGPATAGRRAAFAVKAHTASEAGAKAVLVINSEPELPAYRIGTGSLAGNLRIAMHTRSCTFPPVPVLLLPQEEGERLRVACLGGRAGSVTGEFQVLADSYPRRTLRRELCQACALTFSGIGVLYWIIECLSVEVGGEFMMAEAAASARGIHCSCIDVDMDRLCSRISAALAPWPRNLLGALLAWLALPRLLFSVLFPTRSEIDAIGTTLLHALSFRCRTWAAFALAVACAGGIACGFLLLFGSGVAKAARGSGVISEKDSDTLQAAVMLILEMYMIARLYDAVAASRDEAMYRGLVARARERGAQRLVAVVGAAHANGILRQVRSRGL